jgi:hypothetical protein
VIIIENIGNFSLFDDFLYLDNFKQKSFGKFLGLSNAKIFMPKHLKSYHFGVNINLM